MKRTIIIVWKWEDLEDHPNVDLGFEVLGRPDDSLVRINQTNTPATRKMLEELITSKSKEGDVLVLLHRDHQFGQTDVERLNRFARGLGINQMVRCYLFGEGADPIYYSYSEKGLLDDFGWFMNEPEFTFFDQETNTTRIGEASVVRQDRETGNWKVLPQYFEEVWQTYLFKAKAYVFALREDVLSGFTPKIYFSVDATVNQEGQFQLMERLQSFCATVEKPDNEQQINRDNSSKNREVDHYSKFFLESGSDIRKYYQLSLGAAKNLLEKENANRPLLKEDLLEFGHALGQLINHI